MIQQFYERLLPETPKPESLTIVEQQELIRAARRLSHAVREYLYAHGSYGRVGEPSGKPDKRHDEKKCAACSELQAALDES